MASTSRFVSYRAVNALRLGYKNQSATAVYGNNRCYDLKSTQATQLP